MRRIDQKIVIVTRPTQLAALKSKFGTGGQAKFQLVSARKRQLVGQLAAAAASSGGKAKALVSSDARTLDRLAEAAFTDVDRSSSVYDEAVKKLRADLDFEDLEVPVQMLERDFLPNYVFGPNDIVVTVGQDGLVANVAKYAIGLPIVAVNPDPDRIDGVLLPFRVDQARAAVRAALAARAQTRSVTLAEARLADGQHLLAFNELFIGARSHVSARYKLVAGGKTEQQSSSGILVATGAGSTGWLSSVFNMASSVTKMLSGHAAPGVAPMRMSWEDPRLLFVVREPFVSKTSAAGLTAGIVEPGQQISIESDMASGGVIFSDGVESDFLAFDAGAVAQISTAKGKAYLVTAF
jgi:hypothetical protein